MAVEARDGSQTGGIRAHRKGPALSVHRAVDVSCRVKASVLHVCSQSQGPAAGVDPGLSSSGSCALGLLSSRAL